MRPEVDNPVDQGYFEPMTDDFWSKLDAYLFRFLGFAIGLGGCAGLTMNNPPDVLFHNIYGVCLLLIFSAMAGYSIYATAADLLAKKE